MILGERIYVVLNLGNEFLLQNKFLQTEVAQLVEHWSPKPGVGSSSLSFRADSLNKGLRLTQVCYLGSFAANINNEKSTRYEDI